MRQPSPHRRAQDWPERLARLIEERRSRAFEWGAHDCFLFACDAVLAQTGSDPALAVRGLYDTEAGADAIIGADGLEAYVAGAMAAWGATECGPKLAQRGDFVMALLGNHATCGVHLGTTVAAPATARLAFVPVSRIARAWAV